MGRLSKYHQKDEPSTSKKKEERFNIDKDIDNEYKKVLKNAQLNLPSDILTKKNPEDISKIIKKVENKIKTAKNYIKNNSTTKGIKKRN